MSDPTPLTATERNAVLSRHGINGPLADPLNGGACVNADRAARALLAAEAALSTTPAQLPDNWIDERLSDPMWHEGWYYGYDAARRDRAAAISTTPAPDHADTCPKRTIGWCNCGAQQIINATAMDFAREFIHVRGAHNPTADELEGDQEVRPCAFCRLAGEQAVEALSRIGAPRE